MWGPASCQAARLNSHQAARASPGKEPSDAGEGAASPRRAKPGSRREPTRVGSGPAPAGAAEARQAARGSPCKGRSAKGGRNHRRLEERKRSALPERVPLREWRVVVAGETAQLGAGQRILQTCGGAQPIFLMNTKAA